MAMPLYDLSSVSQATYDEVKELLRQAINNYSGTTDVNRGVISDIVLELTSLLTAATEADVEEVRSAVTLAAITSDPAAFSDEAVDAIASNYRVTRKVGAKATGKIAIALSTNSSVVVSKGALFTIAGLRFQATDTFTSVVYSDTGTTTLPPLPYMRMIGNIGSRYVFLVDVEALENGSGANLPSNITATMDDPPLQFYGACTYGSLTGGVDDETNQQLVARLLAGASVQTWGNRTSLESLIRANYPSTTHVSIVGTGDSVMLRDKHGLVPIGLGGKADVYLRYNALYETKVTTVIATLKSKVGATGSWEFVLGRDVAPGFYDVQKILLPSKLLTEVGFVPSSDVRGLDTSGSIYVPDVTTALEGTYSRYQTATIQFQDTLTNATSLVVNSATASYQVVIRYMPNIDTVQTFLGQSANLSLSSDVLIKAPVPVFTAISFDLEIPTANATPDQAALKTAICAAVHAQGFSNKLTESVISSAVRGVINNASIDNLTMAGSLRKPNGTSVSLTGTSSLTVSNDTTNMVSASTVVFYLAASSISINVVRV